jgi:hypothetical protein
MWGPTSVEHFGAFPDGGGYPKHFFKWALSELSAHRGSTVNPNTILHLCSGSMLTGIRVDIRPEVNPDVVSDCRDTPFPDRSFDVIMADPPYSVDYAENLYGTGKMYPGPGQILNEASRLLVPGGLVAIMHHQVPVFRRPLRLVKVYAVHRGLGFNLVAWSLFRKESA